MRAPEFWDRDDWRARLLAPLSWAYGTSVAWKEAHAVPYHSAAAVVCVGNISVGGTGKTPIAIEIAHRLRARGRRPVFLSRGYGGRLRGPVEVHEANSAADVGDEPLLLRHTAPVVVARDRAEGARFAEQLGDTIVMDDGHQNLRSGRTSRSSSWTARPASATAASCRRGRCASRSAKASTAPTL